MVAIALVIIPIAALLAGTIPAQVVETAALNKGIATGVIGHLLTNASTKATARLAPPNAPAQDTNPAIADANGKTAAQTQMGMEQIHNAGIPYAIIIPIS